MGKGNASFYECFGISRQALACLQRAEELVQRSRVAGSLLEKLQLQKESIQLQRQALKLLRESDRLLKKQAAAKVENDEPVTQGQVTTPSR